jgi:phosphoglycolate phosphatase
MRGIHGDTASYGKIAGEVVAPGRADPVELATEHYGVARTFDSFAHGADKHLPNWRQRLGVAVRTGRPVIVLPRAVIWDLDGTLVDSAPDICRALNSTLAAFGRDALDERDVRRMIGDGVAKLIERGFSATGARPEQQSITQAVELFMVHYSEDPVVSTCLFPGAVDALSGIAALGVPQGICTNKPEAVSRAVLRELGIDACFEAVVGGGTTRARKPDPAPLEHCMTRLGALHGRQGLMIGDSAIDVATARAVGMTVGLVTFGYARSDVRTIGADFLVEDLALVPGMLATV